MDLETLKAELPKVYEAARLRGVNQERDRVTAHIALGKKVGAMSTALDAIRSGATMDPALFQRYAQAGRSRADIAARLEDDDIVQAVLLNAQESPSSHVENSFEKQVADRFEALLDTSAADANIEDL